MSMLQLALPASATAVHVACPQAVAKITSMSVNVLSRTASMSIAIWADADAFKAGAAPVKEVGVQAGVSRPERKDVKRDANGEVVLDENGAPILEVVQAAVPGYTELVDGQYAAQYAAIAAGLYAFLIDSQTLFADATVISDPV
jgi:hypothetical protein